MADNIFDRINTAANDVQAAANALAEKIRLGGDVVVRASNSATGAGAGAKAGYALPANVPPAVKYGAIAIGAFVLAKLLGGRR